MILDLGFRISDLMKSALVAALMLSAMLAPAGAQETMPAPGAPKSVNVPAVQERKLKNGLTVAVIERKNVPLVTVQLLVKNGADSEGPEQAGLANLTAGLLTKGTKTRTATQVAEQIEFLGGSINTGAGWNNSAVTVTVASDKLDQAMAVLADVVLNPTFKKEEIDLLKSQTLDGLAYNLKQPGFLANYVASGYSFDEHPAGGTPESIKSITRDDIVAFHQRNYAPNRSVLIFTGDIAPARASSAAERFFGKWKNPPEPKKGLPVVSKDAGEAAQPTQKTKELRRILVVDLPNSGQASVNYVRDLRSAGRMRADSFYPATVLNSVLGGGYSSRLNQEIRIKRGLSYGAGSSFAWRGSKANFATRTQTKNESAPEVAELVLAEVAKLTDGAIDEAELGPRKLVLTGSFGRNLETTEGLAAALGELYSFDLPTSHLNSYMNDVQAVSDAQIRQFAKANLLGGDLIIVGDAQIFLADLKKRFPAVQIDVIKADALDMSREDLRSGS